jgi:predicted ATPase
VLRSVKLRNFQKHGKRKVKLDDNLTTIVGPSDAGKSSIIRALGFVCLNDSEKSYTKFGKPRAEVSVLVGNNKVDRIKGKAVNGFRLNGRTYKAFRKGVPAPIEELLNVVPENFQRQLDPPSWIISRW